MIDLNTRVTAVEQTGGSEKELVAEGTYTFKVIKIEPWKAQPAKTIQVAERDERGFVVKDDTGKTVRNTVKDQVLYATNITLEIVGGEFAGRRVYHRFDTHPDFLFLIQGFMYACDVGEVVLNDLPLACVSTKDNEVLVEGTVEHQTYNKKVVDKETGIESLEPKTVARITKFARTLGI